MFKKIKDITRNTLSVPVVEYHFYDIAIYHIYLQQNWGKLNEGRPMLCQLWIPVPPVTPNKHLPMVTSGIRAELIWNFLLHRAFVFDGRRNLYLILTDDSHAPGVCVISELGDCYWMPFNFRNQKTFKNKGSLSSRVHSFPGAINGVLVTVQKMI